MRPGLIFIGLFAVLMLLYFLLNDPLGVAGTFLLQAAVVIVILAGTVVSRLTRRRNGWFFFHVEDEAEEQHGRPQSGEESQEAGDDSPDKLRKAG